MLTNYNSAIIAARNAQNLNAVRWYMMIYPFGRKNLRLGLDREIQRRERAAETPIEYFAPFYVEAKEKGGKIVTTDKALFENYVFVKASVKEIFRLKQYEERYNLPRREYKSNGEQYYPYISDEAVKNLQWIAASYQGIIPVYVDDSSWLIKGDKVKIISGPFKGVEATLFDNKKNNRKEIMLVIDNWMSIPLLHIKENQYKVIGLNEKETKSDIKIDDEIIPTLHPILCRGLRGKISEEDRKFVKDILFKYETVKVQSDVMRCKLYSIQAMAYRILWQPDKLKSLISNINTILPAIKAEQAKAQLLTALYACSDNSLFYNCAHTIIDPWTKEASPKKSKLQLIKFLKDYDMILGH